MLTPALNGSLQVRYPATRMRSRLSSKTAGRRPRAPWPAWREMVSPPALSPATLVTPSMVTHPASPQAAGHLLAPTPCAECPVSPRVPLAPLVPFLSQAALSTQVPHVLSQLPWPEVVPSSSCSWTQASLLTARGQELSPGYTAAGHLDPLSTVAPWCLSRPIPAPSLPVGALRSCSERSWTA